MLKTLKPSFYFLLSLNHRYYSYEFSKRRNMASDAKIRRRDSRDSVDRLSYLPRNLIDLILEKLPLRDAVRTSILSKKWRNIWVMQPHLVFDEVFFSQLVSKNGSKRVSIKQKQAQLSEVSKVISNILLVHAGPILKFHLSIPRDLPLHQCLDMNFWIKNISNNGVGKLELFNKQPVVAYKMPSYFFSCLQLTHLSLTKCMLNPPLGFDGFCNLNSVILVDVIITADMSFGTRLDNMCLECCTGIKHLGCHFKYNNNLTELTIKYSQEIDWGWFEYTQKVDSLVLKGVTNSRKEIISLDRLIGNMPGIISLVLDACFLKFSEPGVPFAKRLITTMENLKCLWIESLRIKGLEQIQYFLCLIRNLPNLQDLNLVITHHMDRTMSSVGDYLEQPNFNDMILGQLETVKIWSLCGSRVELHLIKLLLATSPSLRWMELEFYIYDPKEESKISRELMRFPRASPAAQIIWT